MSGTPTIFFDSSIPVLARAVAHVLGAEKLKNGLIVRDTTGRLRFISPDSSPISGDVRGQLQNSWSEALGSYARRDGVLSFSDDAGAQRLLKDTARFPMREGELEFWLLDRRIVGSGWLDSPQSITGGPPRIVFASLKGGVGRSTALAVTASDLSRQGKNVLVVDLDLEAPGIGDMLLSEDRLPRYGTVDFLVENGLSGIRDSYLSEFVGTSPLTSSTGGRVDVLPAFGREALEHPINTLAKISRAVLEDIDPEGSSIPITLQISAMVQRFTARESYDVVLIDTRAGLAEITAPAMLGLGATVLLFGTAQRQTIHGYEALFAGLKLLAERDRAVGKQAEWRLLFKAVYAKAGLSRDAAARHRDNLYDLFAENLYDADDAERPNLDEINFDIDDPVAPHSPLVIPFTQNFVDFDPVLAPDQLSAPFYEQAYRPFLNGVEAILSGGFSDSSKISDPS
jgi:Mrp family chromosome partitioning ATPase